MNIKYDIAVVGGGIVGLLTSLALSKVGCRIIHIEKDNLFLNKDNRTIAISYSSVAFLNTIGLWTKISNKSNIIKKIHISDKGNFGRAEILASDEHLPFLGAIISMKHLLSAVLESVFSNFNIIKSFQTKVINLNKYNNNYSLVIKREKIINVIDAHLIIACDGANSYLRKILNISIKTIDYKQDALVFDIKTDLNNENTAFERFMSDEILAILPKTSTISGCVWTINRLKVKKKLLLNTNKFEELIKNKFGYRLGNIKLITKPEIFHLYFSQVNKIYKGNVLFFGNALHCLHPIFAQGMNLSIRDIGILYDLLKDIDFSYYSVLNSLKEFVKLRKSDHDRIIFFINGFLKLFLSDNFKLVIIRNIGLFLLQRSKLAKRLLLDLIMGKFSKSSTMMRKVIDDEWQNN